MNTLYDHPVYTTRAEFLSLDERVRLAYDRARVVLRTWDLNVDDITKCSPKFWNMQLDPILVRDIGCNNILACHVNLFMGTLAPLLPRRPDLVPIVRKALAGEVIGNFLLSEIGHGLDIMNLETTATKVADGFILHSPTQGASKFMPPTTPIPGCPKMAIVFAKLLVDGDNRGTHPFLVCTSDEHGMCEGVKSIRLPPRNGSSPLDFATTSFDHVKLPESAFLGKSLDAPKDPHASLHAYIWRIPIGSMCLPVTGVNAAKIGASIGIDYSFRRHVQGKGTRKVPIISFRTQQLPILYMTAIAYVLEAWAPVAIQQFMSPQYSQGTRAGMCAVFKLTVCRLLLFYLREVGERLGAQGTFGHNLLNQIEMDVRGISIAEGDVLVLSIRLFSELLLGRYSLPSPTRPDALVSLHSAAIFSRCSQLLATFPGGHRDDRFNDLILPQSEPAILAQGCAYAYCCAADAEVPRPLLDLFELVAIKLDPAWYAENAGVTETEWLMREDRAVRAALPHLRQYAVGLNIRKWVNAPIIDDAAWEEWMRELTSLKSHAGHAMQYVWGVRNVPSDESCTRNDRLDGSVASNTPSSVDFKIRDTMKAVAKL